MMLLVRINAPIVRIETITHADLDQQRFIKNTLHLERRDLLDRGLCRSQATCATNQWMPQNVRYGPQETE